MFRRRGGHHPFPAGNLSLRLAAGILAAGALLLPGGCPLTSEGDGGNSIFDQSRGPRGPRGLDGQRGEPGKTGDQGDAWSQGESGDAGPVGSAGPAGAQGNAGPAGDQGDAGPAGARGAAGAAGPAGATGATGVNCWDLNGNGVGDPDEDHNNDGVFDAADCKGTACWDTNNNGVADPAEDINGDGRFDAGDCLGGPPGPAGAAGLPCWDLNANGVADLLEDRNGDGRVDVLDCQGGPPGPTGLACWDTNGDGVAQPGEDTNGDGLFDARDCRGAVGDAGPPGPPGAPGPQGPTGDVGPPGPIGPAGAAGTSCWDTNGNGIGDPSEDRNLDGVFDSLDCNGGLGGIRVDDGLLLDGDTLSLDLPYVDSRFWKLDGNTGATSESFLGTNDGTAMTIRSTGGVKLQHNTNTWIEVRPVSSRLMSTSTGAFLSLGGTWVNTSDRALKTNVAPLDGDALLDGLMTLEISQWSYLAESDVRHVGPMAQDFFALFGLGEDERHIATVDADGVALAAIKAVNQRLLDQGLRVDDHERRIARTEAVIAELKQENAALRARLDGIIAKLGQP